MHFSQFIIPKNGNINLTRILNHQLNIFEIKLFINPSIPEIDDNVLQNRGLVIIRK